MVHQYLHYLEQEEAEADDLGSLHRAQRGGLERKLDGQGTLCGHGNRQQDPHVAAAPAEEVEEGAHRVGIADGVKNLRTVIVS